MRARILASKRGCPNSDREFSKELFTEVANSLAVFTEEEWESHKDDYKEVLIAVYIRTDVENLVLLIDKDKIASIFDVPSFVCDGGLYPHILVDSGLISGKNMIDSVFQFKSAEAMKRLVVHSTCYPVGAIETSKKYILVFSVVISEDLLRDPEIVLNDGFHFYPIESLHFTDLLQRDISKSLVLVKREDKK